MQGRVLYYTPHNLHRKLRKVWPRTSFYFLFYALSLCFVSASLPSPNFAVLSSSHSSFLFLCSFFPGSLPPQPILPSPVLLILLLIQHSIHTSHRHPSSSLPSPAYIRAQQGRREKTRKKEEKKKEHHR